MAKDSKTDILYINLGGGVGNVGAFRWAFRAKKGSYDNILSELGVVKAKDTDTGLLFKLNAPRPAVVRITYVDASGNIKSANRFCEPDMLSSVTTGGKLNGKKIKVAGKEYNINSVNIKSN